MTPTAPVQFGQTGVSSTASTRSALSMAATLRDGASSVLIGAEPLNAAVDSVYRQMRQVLFAIDIVLQTWGACVTPPFHFAKSLRSAVQFG